MGGQAHVYICAGTRNVIVMREGGRLSVPWLHSSTTVFAKYTTNKASTLVNSTETLWKYAHTFYTHLIGW